MRLKIAILGPGRSGTSLLTQLFGVWGFSIPDGTEFEDAQAGFEHRIGVVDEIEIHKDPWAFAYISQVNPEILRSYDAFILPIRDSKEAALSRVTQERFRRLIETNGDEWLWNTWGVVPGGALSDTSLEGVERVLERGLWAVLETLAKAGIQPRIIHFPTFAADFDYVWQALGDLVISRSSREEALESFRTVVDVDKIRIRQESRLGNDVGHTELVALIEQLRTKVKKLESQNKGLAISREDELAHELDSIKSSRSWTYTAFLRRLASKVIK